MEGFPSVNHRAYVKITASVLGLDSLYT